MLEALACSDDVKLSILGGVDLTARVASASGRRHFLCLVLINARAEKKSPPPSPAHKFIDPKWLQSCLCTLSK